MTNLGAALIARMTSQRLPGKVLTQVEGKPLLAYTLERLQRSTLNLEIVVATSDESTDDPLEAFADRHGLKCIRGPLDDVAGRFLKVTEALGLEGVFRVNGDSPLIDLRLFVKAAQTFVDHDVDLVTNVMPRHYPPGISVELIRSSSFRNVYEQITDAKDREHVTRYFYKNPEQFNIVNLRPDKVYPESHFAVDDPCDLQRFRQRVQLMEQPHWEYSLDDIFALEKKDISRG